MQIEVGAIMALFGAPFVQAGLVMTMLSLIRGGGFVRRSCMILEAVIRLQMNMISVLFVVLNKNRKSPNQLGFKFVV